MHKWPAMLEVIVMEPFVFLSVMIADEALASGAKSVAKNKISPIKKGIEIL